jgi:hypothetical protein
MQFELEPKVEVIKSKRKSQIDETNYPRAKERMDTATTSMSSKLKAPRQNEPLCSTMPYDTTLNPISTVNTAVKNASKYLRICQVQLTC